MTVTQTTKVRVQSNHTNIHINTELLSSNIDFYQILSMSLHGGVYNPDGLNQNEQLNRFPFIEFKNSRINHTSYSSMCSTLVTAYL